MQAIAKISNPMQAFKLRLPNGNTLTGRKYIPSQPYALSAKPLVIGIHGAGFSSQYFDAGQGHSAAILCEKLAVPFVAFDRPGYAESTPVGFIPDGSTYVEQNATLLHKYILPALWNEFGEPNGCQCLILHCHSLGTPAAVIAAGFHAADTTSALYPLGGLVFSGIGSQSHPDIIAFRNQDWSQHEGHETPDASRAALLDIMLPADSTEPEILAGVPRFQCIPPKEDIPTSRVWVSRWRNEWASKMRAPVLIGLAENDRVWMGTEAHLKDIASGFSSSKSVDLMLINSAPHNVEISKWSQEWYTRSFNFAASCATTYQSS